MSVCLTLLIPEQYGPLFGDDAVVSIKFGCNISAHRAIREKACPRLLPDRKLYYFDTRSDGDPFYGSIEKDCYGNPIQWVLAGDFVNALDGMHLGELSGPALAYVRALKPNHPIALYWS